MKDGYSKPETVCLTDFAAKYLTAPLPTYHGKNDQPSTYPQSGGESFAQNFRHQTSYSFHFASLEQRVNVRRMAARLLELSIWRTRPAPGLPPSDTPPTLGGVENAALNSSAGGRPGFVSTRWSLLLAAVEEQRTEAEPLVQEAWAELYRTYCYPVYAFIRRRGHS